MSIIRSQGRNRCVSEPGVIAFCKVPRRNSLCSENGNLVDVNVAVHGRTQNGNLEPPNLPRRFEPFSALPCKTKWIMI